MFWEVLDFINMLDSCVIYDDINSTEFGNCLIYEIFAINWLCQICINIVGFNFRVLSLEVCLNSIDFFLVSESIQYDIVSLFGKGVSNAQSDST